MAVEDSESARALAESLVSHVRTVERVVTNSEHDVQRPSGHRFNNIIFFHASQIDMESPLLNFAALLDLERRVCALQDVFMNAISSSSNNLFYFAGSDNTYHGTSKC